MAVGLCLPIHVHATTVRRVYNNNNNNNAIDSAPSQAVLYFREENPPPAQLQFLPIDLTTEKPTGRMEPISGPNSPPPNSTLTL